MKDFLKSIAKLLPFPITKNLQYDKETEQIIKKVCHTDANTVDIGCHKGEVLTSILKSAPKGQHFGFEPLPDFYEKLPQNFPDNCTFYPVALSNKKGTVSFNYVVSNPPYSGLQQREYKNEQEEIQLIQVETDRLDNLLPNNLKIDFIKIDVEGGEYQVLQGAVETLKKWKPVVVFEHGLGAADKYGTHPSQVYELLKDCGLQVFTMSDWLKNRSALSKSTFVKQFEEGINYYFLAAS